MFFSWTIPKLFTPEKVTLPCHGRNTNTRSMTQGGGPLFLVTGTMCRRTTPTRSMLQGGGPLFPTTGTMCRMVKFGPVGTITSSGWRNLNAGVTQNSSPLFPTLLPLSRNHCEVVTHTYHFILVSCV